MTTERDCVTTLREAAGLETFTRAEAGGTDVQPNPEWMDLFDETWSELSGHQRWYREEHVDAPRTGGEPCTGDGVT